MLGLGPDDHGRRSVGGQGDTSPYFLNRRGRPVFCSSTI